VGEKRDAKKTTEGLARVGSMGYSSTFITLPSH